MKWPSVMLGRITRARCDGPFGSGLKSQHYVDEGARVIRLQNIGPATFVDGDRAYIALDYFRTSLHRHEVRAGDLLIAGLGDEGHPLGRACVAPDGIEPALVKADCFRFRLDQSVLTHAFVAWFLASQAGRDEVAKHARGSTRARINLSGASALQIPVPPRATQIAISDFLDRKTAAIDALIAKKERLVALLEEKRQALITQAVTKGLDPNVPMKDSGIEWLGEIPAHWTVMRVKHGMARTVDCPHSTPEYDADGAFPAVRTADVDRGRLLLEGARRVRREVYLDRVARMVPRVGDILYSREGERFGMAALVPPDTALCLAQRMMIFRPKPTQDSGYLMWLLNSEAVYQQVKQETVGATSPRINIPTISNAWIPCPPLGEQQAIASSLWSGLARIDKTVGAVTKHIELLREYRQAVITAAVTGKLDVTAKEAA